MLRSRSRTLHVTNGDATVPGLRGTGIGGTILPWRDVLHEGPVPDAPEAELRAVRARFLAGEHAADLGTEAELARRDSTLAANSDGEYVLWFEADLYDQLQIVQILAQLHQLGVPADRITLICIGEHPGIAHFAGLGQLTADQLSRLPAAAATTLTESALAHAVRAWRALRAADPSGLNDIAATPSPELRFVAEAFDRLSREYPSTRDGLSLSERRILAALAHGPQTAGSAFTLAAARETRPFLGDTWCFDRIRRLRDAPTPLLGTDPPAAAVDRHCRVSITDAGRRLLDGDDDHVTLNGIDRWIGGVHLSGHTVRWRWNEGSESITRSVSRSADMGFRPGVAGGLESIMHLEQVALIVDDYDDAIRFFVDVLGFELVEDSPSLTGDVRPKRWVVVRPPGATTALLLARADGERQGHAVGDQFAGRGGLFLRVDDFTAAYDRMRKAGVEFVTEPRREPYGQVAVFIDVAGNRWDLLGPRPSG